jgi:hypothetical protein
VVSASCASARPSVMSKRMVNNSLQRRHSVLLGWTRDSGHPKPAGEARAHPMSRPRRYRMIGQAAPASRREALSCRWLYCPKQAVYSARTSRRSRLCSLDDIAAASDGSSYRNPHSCHQSSRPETSSDNTARTSTHRCSGCWRCCPSWGRRNSSIDLATSRRRIAA